MRFRILPHVCTWDRNDMLCHTPSTEMMSIQFSRYCPKWYATYLFDTFHYLVSDACIVLHYLEYRAEDGDKPVYSSADVSPVQRKTILPRRPQPQLWWLILLYYCYFFFCLRVNIQQHLNSTLCLCFPLHLEYFRGFFQIILLLWKVTKLGWELLGVLLGHMTPAGLRSHQ